MGKQGLRTGIAEVEATGELQHVTGANRETFPQGVRNSSSSDERMRAKFASVLPRGL